MKAHLSAFPEV
uniref:Uncharacterized protein n=1 Tax=Arundo donax TaxID=35708 RepID=A0A0A9FC36_ARUDO